MVLLMRKDQVWSVQAVSAVLLMVHVEYAACGAWGLACLGDKAVVVSQLDREQASVVVVKVGMGPL